MRAVLKSVALDLDPANLSSNPAKFALPARMYVGPSDDPGHESFDVTVCTPQWLSKQSREVGGVYNARHHVVVMPETYDKGVLLAWLEARVREVQGATWREVAERLARLGYWEFEDNTA